MSTVALIGPDGAGKTTVCRLLQEADPDRYRYLYMGASRESSNVLLPTTRLVLAAKRLLGRRPPEPRDGSVHGRTAGWRGGLRSLKSAASTANQVAEECFRQVVSWLHQRRGFIVLYDRHFLFDYTGDDVATRNDTLPRRVHVWWLRHIYPRPDLVIFLDVPADVLYHRKGETTPEALAARHRAHREQVRNDPTIIRVDATRPEEVVADRVRATIEARLAALAREGTEIRSSRASG